MEKNKDLRLAEELLKNAQSDSGLKKGDPARKNAEAHSRKAESVSDHSAKKRKPQTGILRENSKQRRDIRKGYTEPAYSAKSRSDTELSAKAVPNRHTPRKHQSIPRKAKHSALRKRHRRERRALRRETPSKAAYIRGEARRERRARSAQRQKTPKSVKKTAVNHSKGSRAGVEPAFRMDLLSLQPFKP